MKLGQRLRRWWPRKTQPDTLAEGIPQFRDLIAPTVFETTGSSVVVDGQHIRTVALMGYPRHVWPGWLDTFTNSDLPADVAVPLSELPAAVEFARALAEARGRDASIVGHVGDGNFHLAPTATRSRRWRT